MAFTIDVDEPDSKAQERDTANGKEIKKDYSERKTDNEIKKLESQIKTYYQRLLFFSFLTRDRVSSMDDILTVIEREDNSRLAKNLFLDRKIIQKISKYMDPFKIWIYKKILWNIKSKYWKKSISEIDQQLFDKYNFSAEEREHIKSSIMDM